MDTVFECAKNFESLLDTEYLFVVSKSRKLIEMRLNFISTDFFHLAGFQYLDDIDIPRNRNKTLQLIQSGIINDALLYKSAHYYPSLSVENYDIQSRINQLRHLEQYLDTDNNIKVFDLKANYGYASQIKADYVIRSVLPSSSTIAFVFLRKREESDKYCVASFFPKKSIEYGGQMLYWMLKQKTNGKNETVLFQHPTYNKA